MSDHATNHSEIIRSLDRLEKTLAHGYHATYLCPCCGYRIQEQLTEVLHRLKNMETQIMGLKEDMDANFAKLDDETTAIGALITKLAGSIKNSMTDEEVADVKAKFGTLSERLTTLSVDPTNPVPPPPPVFAALRAKK